jgi:polyhydroxybutyrate depolymerase
MKDFAMVALIALGLAACSGKSRAPTSPLITARPYEVDVPAGYDKTKSYPLIVLLHGYGTNGFVQDRYFGFNLLADDRHVLVAHPDGTKDASGILFWNATDACCDFNHVGVDDVVIDDMEKNYNVDAKHVYFVGHSNGGFMSHRMACDAAPRIGGIVALAGDVWKDPSRCNPSMPVAVLQVHGDADTDVNYNGSATEPSAVESIATWAQKNGCTGGLQATGETFHIDLSRPPNETIVARWSCSQGAAELWTMQGSTHVPNLIQPDWGNRVFDWLIQHGR